MLIRHRETLPHIPESSPNAGAGKDPGASFRNEEGRSLPVQHVPGGTAWVVDRRHSRRPTHTQRITGELRKGGLD